MRLTDKDIDSRQDGEAPIWGHFIAVLRSADPAFSVKDHRLGLSRRPPHKVRLLATSLGCLEAQHLLQENFLVLLAPRAQRISLPFEVTSLPLKRRAGWVPSTGAAQGQ